jgi:hypothetical protein
VQDQIRLCCDIEDSPLTAFLPQQLIVSDPSSSNRSCQTPTSRQSCGLGEFKKSEDISQLLTSTSLPGQESGNGLVDILYGSTSPGGKLPYTIAKREADYGTAVVSGNDDYPEGLYIDYRHFDKEGIAPRYEFGFGLCE